MKVQFDGFPFVADFCLRRRQYGGMTHRIALFWSDWCLLLAFLTDGGNLHVGGAIFAVPLESLSLRKAIDFADSCRMLDIAFGPIETIKTEARTMFHITTL
jgi:hypothetical protein